MLDVTASLGGLLVALGLGAATLRALALRPRLHLLLQEWSGATAVSHARLTPAERLAVARALTAYLDGAAAELRTLWQHEGAPPGGATPRAQAHLRDVRAIFQWLRRLRLAGLAALAAVLLPASLRTRVLHSAGRSSLAAAGLLALAALIDFTRLFAGYHRLFFRDENWRLEPQEDYLALLYPEAVYRLGALLWSVLWAATGGVLLLLARVPYSRIQRSISRE